VPFILILLLALIIAQVGFWDTLGGILGAVAVVVVFFLLVAAATSLGLYLLYRRIKRRF
jgi:hypothetical protein